MIKILIADDQELIRQSLMIILNSESSFEGYPDAGDGRGGLYPDYKGELSGH